MDERGNNSLLTLGEVTKSFGGLTAINRISFTVREGQIKSVIGPNGAGKTTLFNLIMGIYSPDSGKIWFLGDRIERLKPYKIAPNGILRTFETFKLFTN